MGTSLWQSIRLQREPYETEINEEVAKEYKRLEELDGDNTKADIDEDIADMSTRMDDMEAKMDASQQRLEAKIDAANTRLEAMFKELLSARASNSSAPTLVDAEVNPEVTNTPPVVSNLHQPPSPNHGAAGVSNESGDDDARKGAAEEHVGGGGRLEEDVHAGQEEDADAGAADEGPAYAGTEVEVQNAENEDDLSLDMDNAQSAQGTKDTVEDDQPQQVQSA